MIGLLILIIIIGVILAHLATAALTVGICALIFIVWLLICIFRRR